MSGLFDAPFLYQPESIKIPLRRRENDAFTSPTRRRRRPDIITGSHNNDPTQWCIRTAMKAILVSPIVVIVLWSLMAVLFTHRIRTYRNTNVLLQRPQSQQSVRSSSSSASFFQKPSKWQQLQQQQQQQLPQQQQQQQQQYYYSFPKEQQQPPEAEPVLLSLYNTETETPLAIPLADGALRSTPPQQQQLPGPRRQPLPHRRDRMPFQRQPQPQDFTTTKEGLGNNNYPITTLVPPEPDLLLPPPIPDAAEPVPPLWQLSHHQSPGRRPGVRYYYYDPQAVTRDARGKVLFLPNVVYDATTGQAIALQSLSTATKTTRIRLEEPPLPPPPPLGPPRTILHHNVTTDDTNTSSSSNSNTGNYTHPNTVHTVEHRKQSATAMTLPPMPRGLAIPDAYYSWGASHASDSSVIVVTVGVMALLVGALSARKLRSKNMLSACIENETLEDDAAYDAAYTTHQYNTFQQGWKGDLEKFDV